MHMFLGWPPYLLTLFTLCLHWYYIRYSVVAGPDTVHILPVSPVEYLEKASEVTGELCSWQLTHEFWMLPIFLPKKQLPRLLMQLKLGTHFLRSLCFCVVEF